MVSHKLRFTCLKIPAHAFPSSTHTHRFSSSHTYTRTWHLDPFVTHTTSMVAFQHSRCCIYSITGSFFYNQSHVWIEFISIRSASDCVIIAQVAYMIVFRFTAKVPQTKLILSAACAQRDERSVASISHKCEGHNIDPRFHD